MKDMLAKLLAVGLMLLAGFACAAEHAELKAFPPPGPGMQRFVIVLPHKERGEDESFRVEILAGRHILADGVNLLRLGNRIEPRTLKGWGYTYYELSGPSTTMSTMMAPPPGSAQVERFVTASPLHIAYNSRLPVVVYVPDGYEVRYRIWNAPTNFEKAESR
jgi:ecotin